LKSAPYDHRPVLDEAITRANQKQRKKIPMRKVIAATFLSLEGVMQALGGPEEYPTGGFKHGG
jgi:hypothetical protein